jgi:hypothetical protein
MACLPRTTCDSSPDDIFRISLLGRSSLHAAAEMAASAEACNPSAADHWKPAAGGIVWMILNRCSILQKLLPLTSPPAPSLLGTEFPVSCGIHRETSHTPAEQGDANAENLDTNFGNCGPSQNLCLRPSFTPEARRACCGFQTSHRPLQPPANDDSRAIRDDVTQFYVEMVFVFLRILIIYNLGLVLYSVRCAVVRYVPVESMLRAVRPYFDQHFGSLRPHANHFTRRVPVFAVLFICIATAPLCAKGREQNSCAVHSGGAVSCWGWNGYGQVA